MNILKSVLLGAVPVFALAACATTDLAASAPEAVEVTESVTGAKSETKSKAKENAKPKRVSKGGGHSKADFYNAYDADGDGNVSQEEYKKVRDAGFDARDPNSDEQVLVDEYVAEYEARLAQDLAEQRDRQLKQAYVRFGILDADKDGILTREEFQASGVRMFSRLDSNADGVVNEVDEKDAY